MTRSVLFLPLVAALASGCGRPPVAGATGKDTETVQKGNVAIEVVETGTIDAVRVVEVKGRVSGRIQKLYVDEGDTVQQGQLIAVIDPQETRLQVRQNQAQVRSAESRIVQTNIEIDQRDKINRAAVKQSELRLANLERELRAQPTLTRASVESARANWESAKQALERLEKSAQPNQRVSTQMALQEARASLKNAEAEYARQENLLRDGYSSRRELENASLQLELARTRLRSSQQTNDTMDNSLRLELLSARQDLIRAKATYDQANANTYIDEVKKKEVESARADLAKARVALRDVESLRQSNVQNRSSVEQLRSVLDDSLRQLGETEIRAPISGIISKKFVQEGELVSGLSNFSPGTSIFRLEDRGAMRVKLQVNEIDTARLQKGMDAEITIDAIPGEKFKGRIDKLAPASIGAIAAQGGGQTADSVVKYEIEVRLDKADPRLRSGMSAKVRVAAAERKDAAYLPAEFVGKDTKGWFVMLPASDPKGKDVRKDVKVGLVTSVKVEILDGVKVGDKVKKPPYTGPKRTGFMEGGPDGN